MTKKHRSKKSDALISIVIPCFNAEQTIREAIQSALDQTYSPVEIIVINDGSTDGSQKIIQSFGDAVRWESSPNRGGGAARNLGARIARGAFIQFLDADDLLDPEKLRKQYACARENPSADLVFCDGITRKERTETVRYRFSEPFEGTDDSLVYILRHQIPTPAPLHGRKNLLAVGGFREDLPCAQERDLMIRLAAAGNTFVHLRESLYVQRRFPGSVSNDYKRVLAQYGAILQPVYDQLKETGKLTNERARAFAEMLAQAARHNLKLGEKDEALDYFRQARKMHPSGGLTVYGRAYRLTHRLFGPVTAERLARFRHGRKQKET